MSIKKTLLLAAMALAAIAVMAPAVASAQQTHGLTDPDGTFLPAGAKVTMTTTNQQTTTEAGTFECQKATLHLEVVTNTDEHVLLKQLGAATTAVCVLNIGIAKLPATTTDGTVGVGEENLITFNTWGTATTTITTTVHVYEDAGHTAQIITCHFMGTMHMQATDGTDVVHASPSHVTKTPGEESCPMNQATLHGTYTLETSDGTPVTFDFHNTG